MATCLLVLKRVNAEGNKHIFKKKVYSFTPQVGWSIVYESGWAAGIVQGILISSKGVLEIIVGNITEEECNLFEKTGNWHRSPIKALEAIEK